MRLRDTLKSIAESRAYKVTRGFVGIVRFFLGLPGRILRRLRWLDGHRRYANYYTRTKTTPYQLDQQVQQAKGFAYRPLISIVVPMYNTDPDFLVEMVKSVQEQTYTNWELLLVDDASSDDKVRTLSKKMAKNDARIVTKFLTVNKNIAGATNEGIAIARGEYISLLDHDDILHPSALFSVVMVLNKNDKLDVIYTDEDKIDENGKHIDPFLKPDWNQELLYSISYIAHFTTIRGSVLRAVGGERSEYDGAQDWDLFLRATHAVKPENIYHVPKILYTWRVHGGSTAKSLEAKPYVIEAQRRLLDDNLRARGLGGEGLLIQQNQRMQGSWIVRHSKQARERLHMSGDAVRYDKIKGIAMSEREIKKFIGSESLTTRVYRDCQYQYSIDGEAGISGGFE